MNSTDNLTPHGKTLQSRISTAALLTAVVVLVAACAVFILDRMTEDNALQIRRTRELAQVVAHVAAPALSLPEPARTAQARQTLEMLAAAPEVLTAYITDPRGAPVAVYVRAGIKGDWRRRGHVTLDADITADGHRLGALRVVDASRDLSTALPRYLAVTGALLFGSAGLALLLGRRLARNVVDPISRLSDLMRTVARSRRLDARAPKTTDDEVGMLTDAFNILLDRLSEHDVALRQTMADLITARDAADDANRLKSEFLANMSHEIRTPLNGILAMAQVMAADELLPGQRDRLAIVRQSGDVLLEVLNDILDVAKIEAGRLTLDRMRFSPETVVRHAVAAFSPMAEARGLTLSLIIEGDASRLRMGDTARIRQILNNLISNGLKFTITGGVEVTVAVERDDLRLTVADTGVGIPPERIPLLFQKFVQLDASPTRRFGGTGLGLAICHDLCSMMGGRIWLDETRRQGAAFHVLLPLPYADALSPDTAAVDASSAVATPEAEAVGDLPALSPERPGTGNVGTDAVDPDPIDQDAPALRILAAEDNATNRLVLEAMISILGFDLDTVEDGQAAVEAWTRQDYDLILMDIQMPVMDGMAATRAIREAEARTGRPRTPIIAVSANAMEHQVRSYREIGIDEVVPKPIELSLLHEAMVSVLTGDDREHCTEDAA
jgi:two-component system, sensor histidine kinase